MRYAARFCFTGWDAANWTLALRLSVVRLRPVLALCFIFILNTYNYGRDWLSETHQQFVESGSCSDLVRMRSKSPGFPFRTV